MHTLLTLLNNKSRPDSFPGQLIVLPFRTRFIIWNFDDRMNLCNVFSTITRLLLHLTLTDCLTKTQTWII